MQFYARIESPTRGLLFVSEFLSGGTLQSNLHEEGRQFDPVRRLEFAEQLLSGLIYVHTFGAHLDLRSDQLLMDEAHK